MGVSQIKQWAANYKEVIFGNCLLLLLFSCQSDACAIKVGVFEPSKEAEYSFQVSISLQKIENLRVSDAVYGQSFCMSDATVFYRPDPKYSLQVCFQFAYDQTFKGASTHSYGTARYKDEVINPDKFFSYYKSIPQELNKFLVLHIQGSTDTLKNSGLKNRDTVGAYDDLWSTSGDASFNLNSLLHSFTDDDHDSFISIYLPLNLGIKTPEYTGVLPDKTSYRNPANNFANPAFKLLPHFQNKITLSNLVSDYKVFGVEKGCYGFTSLRSKAEILPELLNAALSEYQTLVQDYLKRPGTVIFEDPYASP